VNVWRGIVVVIVTEGMLSMLVSTGFLSGSGGEDCVSAGGAEDDGTRIACELEVEENGGGVVGSELGTEIKGEPVNLGNVNVGVSVGCVVSTAGASVIAVVDVVGNTSSSFELGILLGSDDRVGVFKADEVIELEITAVDDTGS